MSRELLLLVDALAGHPDQLRVVPLPRQGLADRRLDPAGAALGEYADRPDGHRCAQQRRGTAGDIRVAG